MLINIFCILLIAISTILFPFPTQAQQPEVGKSIDPLFRFLHTIFSPDEFITRIPTASSTDTQDNPKIIIDQSGKMVTATPGPTVILDEKLNRLPGGKVTFYCQGNTQWQNICSLGAAGCGPSSVAMVLTAFGLSLTPPDVDQVMRQRGWRACGNADSSMKTALHSDWLPSLGFHVGAELVNNKILDLEATKRALDNGAFIIASSQEFPCVNCRSSLRIGHIFVIDGIDVERGLVSIRDPNNCSYTDGNDEIAKNVWRSISEFPWYYAYPITKL